MKRAIFCVAVLLFISAAGADTIYLSDGTKIEGDVKRDGSDWVITGNGTQKRVPADAVTRIELSGKRSSGNNDDKLASLRRAVDNLSDVSQIIQRYEQFVDQVKGTAAEAEAQKDLVVWRQRQADGLVKAAGKWVTPAERDALKGQANLTADQARELIKQNRLKEADTVIAQALAQDPQCAPALYLRGYLQIKAGQFPDARKSVEAAAALVPNHAPTLNNLAVILYRQNQQGAALNVFNQAMLAAPADPAILKNVAEALHSLPDNQKTNAPAKKAQATFDQQIAALDAKMLQQGLHRWGATYLNESDYNRVVEADKQIKAQLAQLSSDYDATKARIDQINESIATNNQELQQLQNQSYAVDAQGRLMTDAAGRPIPVGLPPQYYQVQADNQRLAAERTRATAHLGELERSAKQIQQQLPFPQYTGTQEPIGAEGTPVAAAGR